VSTHSAAVIRMVATSTEARQEIAVAIAPVSYTDGDQGVAIVWAHDTDRTILILDGDGARQLVHEILRHVPMVGVE
jgi:hypothetical protein